MRHYFYDANGNVGQMVNPADGAVTARYEYDPFGKTIVADGIDAVGNAVRFSTKYTDYEAGLVYYGYRSYDSEIGRWLSRDPIEEIGSRSYQAKKHKRKVYINLYRFVENNPTNFIDIFGLETLFKKMWNNHPSITGNDPPCTTNGKPNFDNQCAIRLGVAMTAAGINLGKASKVTFCWHHPKSVGHVIRAEEFAKYLSTSPIKGIGSRQKVNPNKYAKLLSGLTGIIFFKDYWQRKGESFANRSGDHIDLWNGSRLTKISTWFRIHLNIGRFGLHNLGVGSDFRCAKEVWFWHVN